MLTTRREFMVWTGAAAAVLALPRWARAGRAEGLIVPWNELAPGLHANVDPMTGGNTVVLAAGGEALVIDSKYPFVGAALLADARSLAGGESPPITLLNTHHHGDHTGGNVAFAGQAKRLAHKQALPRIEAGFESQYKTWITTAPRQALRNAAGNDRVLKFAEELAAREAQLTAKDWLPETGLEDAATLHVGGVTAEVRHLGPGHTDNDVVVKFPEKNLLVMGDLVFNSLTPYFDPEGGVTARGWIKCLAAANELCDDATVVVPGHGPVGDRTIIQGQQRYLEQLIEAVRADIEAGLTKERAQSKTYEFMQGMGFIQAIPRAIGAVYDELTNQG